MAFRRTHHRKWRQYHWFARIDPAGEPDRAGPRTPPGFAVEAVNKQEAIRVMKEVGSPWPEVAMIEGLPSGPPPSDSTWTILGMRHLRLANSN